MTAVAVVSAVMLKYIHVCVFFRSISESTVSRSHTATNEPNVERMTYQAPKRMSFTEREACSGS